MLHFPRRHCPPHSYSRGPRFHRPWYHGPRYGPRRRHNHFFFTGPRHYMHGGHHMRSNPMAPVSCLLGSIVVFAMVLFVLTEVLFHVMLDTTTVFLLVFIVFLLGAVCIFGRSRKHLSVTHPTVPQAVPTQPQSQHYVTQQHPPPYVPPHSYAPYSQPQYTHGSFHNVPSSTVVIDATPSAPVL
ncbi:hypothetical protein GEMRC1_002489 [Eukaryota sp. GEM-RC1]